MTDYSCNVITITCENQILKVTNIFVLLGKELKNKILKRGAIPSIFKWKDATVPDATVQRAACVNRRKIGLTIPPAVMVAAADITVDMEEVVSTTMHSTAAVQTDPLKLLNKETQASPLKTLMDIEKLEHNPQALHFYTGLETYSKFMFVFETLGPATIIYYIFFVSAMHLLQNSMFIYKIIS